MSAPLFSTCPLCRDQRLERISARAHCGGCGCRLEFDAADGRLARIARFPREYEHLALALADHWYTRREMFAAVDAARSAPTSDAVDDFDESRDENSGGTSDQSQVESRAESRAGREVDRSRWMPLITLTGVLVFGCLCAAAASVVALGLFVSNVWLSDGATPVAPQAALPPGTAAPQSASAALPGAAEMESGSDGLPAPEQVAAPVPGEAVLPAPDAASPAPADVIPPVQVAATTAPPPTDLPIATRPRRNVPPALPAPTAVPTPLPPPSPLDSPLPAPPNDALPGPELPTLPPTFTPPSNSDALPTLSPPLASATSVPASPTPAPTPGPAPSATPTYAPGSVLLLGDLVMRVEWAGEDMIRIQNTSGQAVSLNGMKLVALVPNGVIPNVAPSDPRLIYEFTNGATILGNQECTIYTRDVRLSDPCPFGWTAAAGLLWPDVPGKGVTALLIDAEGRELYRVTY